MEEKKKGGQRENAGRKPADDPKMPITVYIETSIIEKNGGRIELAQRIVDTVKSDFVPNPVTERVSEKLPSPLKKGLPKTIKVEYKESASMKQNSEKPIIDNSARIAELEKELANPPKNLTISVNMWKAIRYEELKKLKQQ